jgi:putative spermidine/putrescine transport system permease protein
VSAAVAIEPGGLPKPGLPSRALPMAVLLLAPIALVNAIGFILPVMNLFLISLRKGEASGAITEIWTAANWINLAGDGFYLELLWTSISTSLMITLATLACSYPIALYLHRSKGTLRSVLLVLVISPLLTSAVVRTYGWIAILSDKGMINAVLGGLGLPAQRLIFNKLGVVIGLTEILMPYMILALLAGFGKLDSRLEEAAATLGAKPRQAFLRVVLPLSLPGVALGCLLCFVLAISSFITPKLLGGGRVFLLATEIYDQAIVTLNWPLAATLSMVVLIVFGAALVAYARILKALD